MSITIAVDVAKSIFEVAVSDRPGRVVKRARLLRSQFARLLGTQPPATVLMEADNEGPGRSEREGGSQTPAR